ncbi:hypothetical protein EW026_g2104 [Hermanssonia centrifuga]|uniref:Uncharacterized protein n=1 Tax=Hermanssonia centrifuga TaxID=98765 RepID=A0A4S4KPB9_9APHY|nr:hypothetical protein EW026_g2104 [Hermanssonia centrifuga]
MLASNSTLDALDLAHSTHGPHTRSTNKISFHVDATADFFAAYKQGFNEPEIVINVTDNSYSTETAVDILTDMFRRHIARPTIKHHFLQFAEGCDASVTPLGSMITAEDVQALPALNDLQSDMDSEDTTGDSDASFISASEMPPGDAFLYDFGHRSVTPEWTQSTRPSFPCPLAVAASASAAGLTMHSEAASDVSTRSTFG